MSHKKICVVVLGSEAVLKNALITNILGKDLFIKTSVLQKTEIYENNTFKVIRAPDVSKLKGDIREVFAINGNPDMSLLVVKEWFSTQDVWKQIEDLAKLTKKNTDEFTVVLPLSRKHSEAQVFRCCTIGQLFTELSRMAEGRDLMQPSMSQAGLPNPGTSTPYGCPTAMDETGYPHSVPSATRVNLVLLGLSGSGKSASGNTIIGDTIFPSRVSSNLITKECIKVDTEIGGRRVRVIDTPDIFDDDIDSSIKNQHVRKCKELCQGESSVYLLVMHVSRFTDGDRDILKKLGEAFGSRVHEQTIIMFTREDDLTQGELTKDAFLRSFTPDLRKIAAKCGNRCVFFENKSERSCQVEKLMQTVDQIIKHY